MSKIEYNLKSSFDYNWSPNWFDCVKYDSELIEAISQFQKSQDIKPDGMCGPVTLKKKYSERLSQIQKHETNFLIFGGNPIPLKWDKVETFLDDSQWVSKYYNSEIGEKRRDIKYLVNHWDVTLSAAHCHKILNSPNYFLVLGTREPHPGTEPKNAYYISHDGQNWFVYQDKCYAANNIGVSA